MFGAGPHCPRFRQRRYGHMLMLKGNLHTTEVMLRGTPHENLYAMIETARTYGRY